MSMHIDYGNESNDKSSEHNKIQSIVKNEFSEIISKNDFVDLNEFLVEIKNCL